MKKFIYFLFCFILISSYLDAQSPIIIKQIALLDSNSERIVLGKHPIIRDYDNNIHLFYGTWGEKADYVKELISSDNGLTWSGPDTVSYYTRSTSNLREHIKEISAAVKIPGDIGVIYRYDGPPYYISGWDDYPPSHVNYVQKNNGKWQTLSKVISDWYVQDKQGNKSTVCYLNDCQIIGFVNNFHFFSYDYAWFATKYNIIYDVFFTGMWWTGGDTLRTFDLGDYDNIIFNAPSAVINNDTLFALWYQRYDCVIEMKTLDKNWSPGVQVLFKDKYFKPVHPTSYIVKGGFNYDSTRAAVAMLRSATKDYNELILLRKEKNRSWAIDTTQLTKVYYRVEPMYWKDTTYLILFNNSNYDLSMVKYTDDAGFSGETAIFTSDTSDRVIDIRSLFNASLPIAYVTKNSSGRYYLKIGKFNGTVTGVEKGGDNMPIKFKLYQNYPNPFNPATIIKYSVPKVLTENANGVRVRLKVYDILGKEVKTLVDEYQRKGIYRVRFNGSNLTSGLYFYRITIGRFSETKKMLLIR